MGPILEWSQADMQTHIEFQIALNGELSASSFAAGEGEPEMGIAAHRR
jgi:hypothetical protein